MHNFILILKEKEFQVPSNFASLQDVNPYIYDKLTINHKYEIKSNVSEIILQEFISHWVNSKIPLLTPDNIFEFDMLSQEFDRMKDVIQLYKISIINNSFLSHKIDYLKTKAKQKTKKLNKLTIKYGQIIHIFFKIHCTGFPLIYHKNEIKDSLENEDGHILEMLLGKRIIENDLIYTINEENKTAGVLRKSSNQSNIFIPRSIKYEGEDFIITFIHTGAFKNSQSTKSIQFSEDSDLQIIDKEAFCDTSITNVSIPSTVTQICEGAFSDCMDLESIHFSNDSKLRSIGKEAISYSNLNNLTIPSMVEELEEGWCRGMSTINSVSIMPNNKKFAFMDEKIIVGKSDINSSNYDVLFFAVRNIQKLIVPSFIKYISPYAFDECKMLKIIEFSEDSELLSIDKFSFSYSEIQSIVIPKNVIEIGKFAFFCCHYLAKIEFEDDSQLMSIYKNAFAYTQIEQISIPSHTKKIGDFALNHCLNLKNVEFKENSELVSIGSYAFANTIITGILIPPHVTDIGEGAFSDLFIVELSENSELHSIRSNVFIEFSDSILMIPAKLNIKTV